MSSNSDNSCPSSPDLTDKDPDFNINNIHTDPHISPRVTRSKTKINPSVTDKNNEIDLISFDSTVNFEMSELSLETAIKLIPHFNGQNDEDIYPFINACEFAMSCVKETCKPILLKAISTKLNGKAFTVTQNREISDWVGFKSLLESAFCTKRTPGYLQLELNSTRQKLGEPVQDYSGRIEKLFHELCNVSITGKKPVEADAIRNYIKETTLTSYVEGLYPNLRQIINTKTIPTLHEAIKESLEEEKLLESNKEARRLLQNNSKPRINYKTKYCNICKKNNHSTINYRFAVENKQKQEITQKPNTTPQPKMVQKLTCTYCKARGHIKEDCFKKKRVDSKYSQQNTSGNESRPSTSDERSVKEIKISAQE